MVDKSFFELCATGVDWRGEVDVNLLPLLRRGTLDSMESFISVSPELEVQLRTEFVLPMIRLP